MTRQGRLQLLEVVKPHEVKRQARKRVG